jgi:hypothetical protein
MRSLLLVVLAAAAVTGLQACSNSCQDLGAKICSCSGGGTSSDTCKQQIKNLLDSVGVYSADRSTCSAALDTCVLPAELTHSPAQVDDPTFCEWLTTPCGKVSCGLAAGDRQTVCEQGQTGP